MLFLCRFLRRSVSQTSRTTTNLFLRFECCKDKTKTKSTKNLVYFIIFYNAVISEGSQVGSWENPPNVNSYPSPIPTNVQKTVFPSRGSPTVVTPQIFPIVNQRCDFWFFWHFQKFSGNISPQMGRSFYKVLGFILNKRKLFLILTQSLVEIVNMQSLHGLRNVFWFENLFVFSSFVVEKLIVVDDVTIFELLWNN